MSSSFAEEVFERGQWDFAIPQRLRIMHPTFSGTFKLAIQSFFPSLLQNTLPLYLSRMLFYNFIFFSLALCILLCIELFNERRVRDEDTGREEDLDLLVVIRKLLKVDGWAYLVVIVCVITIIGDFIGFAMITNFHKTEAFPYLLFPICIALAIVLFKVLLLFHTF